ncbi:MAG: anthranilate synthase component 1 [Candidatus Diapherotrites archaeon]|nr:anthranilate synthase component 1 [Candidatus Diapherotrites archaeon]
MVPIHRTLEGAVDPIEFFSLLSDGGKKENCILLESADIVKKYGEKSIGCCSPCLKVSGKEKEFEILALNETGGRFLRFVEKDFDFCSNLKIKENSILGKVERTGVVVSEEERLLLKTQADVLRVLAFKFKQSASPFPVAGGLFGAISYDFIDQFELLPKSKKDAVGDADFEMLFCDNLFLIDHKEKKTAFIANALLTGEGDEKEAERCERVLGDYSAAFDKINNKKSKREIFSGGETRNQKIFPKISSDTSKEEFVEIVQKCKRHIVAGDVFQIVPSRTTIVETSALPLAIYKQLRELNPSPYMFYFNTAQGALFGSSPETFLKVEGKDREKIVEIRPIAGTKPRGLVNGKIDMDLDSRMENELRSDEKELAEHTMLVDLARNDVARVSVPGTRFVDRPHYVEKYSHVMHLVSNVSGTLKPGLDALHAYLASMNMGTLTGAPKVKAMELLRALEKTKRGYYGGAIGYLTLKGDFDSAIVIRSVRMKGKNAFVRAGAGVVFDSVPEKREKRLQGRGLQEQHADGKNSRGCC